MMMHTTFIDDPAPVPAPRAPRPASPVRRSPPLPVQPSRVPSAQPSRIPRRTTSAPQPQPPSKPIDDPDRLSFDRPHWHSTRVLAGRCELAARQALAPAAVRAAVHRDPAAMHAVAAAATRAALNNDIETPLYAVSSQAPTATEDQQQLLRRHANSADREYLKRTSAGAPRLDDWIAPREAVRTRVPLPELPYLSIADLPLPPPLQKADYPAFLDDRLLRLPVQRELERRDRARASASAWGHWNVDGHQHAT
ncbi:hypothetical protein BC828DRAFT_376561 [Blastocladiella britannica]|nr:hypothetical protein BC828DRAFT_376561 [Blastocladiella britannica]